MQLAAIAALQWLVVLVPGLSLDHHPDAPAAVGVAAFVLVLLVRHPRPDRGRSSPADVADVALIVRRSLA